MRFPTALGTFTALVMTSLGLAACGLSGGKAEPVTITRANYQPFGANYRGVSFGRTTQYFDEQPTETDFGLEYFISTDVAVAGAGEGLAATFVLDSVLLLAGATGGVSAAQVDSARATTFRANMARDGRLTDFVGGGLSGGLARELADRVLRPFFPILPEQGAETGAVWADTVETQVVVNGLDNSIRMLSEHSAIAWTLLAGERALHVITVSSYTFSGSGTQSGRSFTIDGNGRRHIHSYLSESGRYLGLVSADTSDGEAHITDMEMIIPIHQTRLDSLSIR